MAIKLHPQNNHYFEYNNKPTILMTSAEHYGSVLNLDFDYVTYLDELQRNRLNYTRIFSGTYVGSETGVLPTPLNPAPGRFICPWNRSDVPGYIDGGNKFDLDQWDQNYFNRLKDFIEEASDRGIVVEYTFFSLFYDNDRWFNSPMYYKCNVNNIGNVSREYSLTLENGDLLSKQEDLVRKVMYELKDYDNLIYEICNEPYNDCDVSKDYNPHGCSMNWQRFIGSIIVEVNNNHTNKHLIAQNFGNFGVKVTERGPGNGFGDRIDGVDIINLHYSVRGDSIFNTNQRNNYDLDIPLCQDENGFNGSADMIYRKESWITLTCGNAMCNTLDFSFQVDNPQGEGESRIPTHGASDTFRDQLKILIDIMDDIDFINMKPRWKRQDENNDILVSTAPINDNSGKPVSDSITYLSKDGEKYLILVATRNLHNFDITLDIPQGNYNYKWIDIESGDVNLEDNIQHGGGNMILTSNTFNVDSVLIITSIGVESNGIRHIRTKNSLLI